MKIYLVWESDGYGGENLACAFSSKGLALTYIEDNPLCYDRVDEQELDQPVGFCYENSN